MIIRASSTLALYAALSIILASVSLTGCGAGHGDVRLVAFPAAAGEQRVLDALSSKGVVDAIGSSNAVVPLSDYSAIVMVPFGNAEQRSSGGDPRRTPLIDELERRFNVAGPGGTTWQVVHISGSSPGKDKAVKDALDSLAVEWAWDAPARRSGSKYLWLPAVFWAAWLVSRKPRLNRAGRSMLAIAWLPVLLASSPLSAILVVVLEAATATAYPLFRSGSLSRLVPALWPYAAAVLGIACLEPGLLSYLAASAALMCGFGYLLPHVERLSLRRWLHEPPRFKPLTGAGLSAASSVTRRAALVPAAAILIVAVAFPGLPSSRDGAAEPMMIETGARSGSPGASAIMDEHLAYQYALTFGRLGEAAWGDRSFSSAYRYSEESGRLSIRDPDNGDLEGLTLLEARLAGHFDAALTVLADRRPLRVADDKKKLHTGD
ncbi:MAG: hypothetical protein CVV51_11435 [Spirochaetae bacterium HGW-Spirochaetae-7]|nr:MAG: hypothetical protein CVV51_11435 [Spirochaetae bacterium HGW-Spirochaetae-7]